MNMNHIPHYHAEPSFARRRDFLARTGQGMGMLALAGMLQSDSARAASNDLGLNPLAPRQGHFTSKAKSVIWLFMNGGQSQVDTWDYKPALAKHDGQELKGFDKFTGFFSGEVGPLMKSPFKFEKKGQSGTWVPEIFPNMVDHVDDMAFIHSCFTETNNHSPALFQINTGFSRMGFPCVGSWVTYGLGSESDSLPGFVVLQSGPRGPRGGNTLWSSGFLPTAYQGVPFRGQGTPILHLDSPAGISPDAQRDFIDTLTELNQQRVQKVHDPEIETRIAAYETAFRMQSSAPELISLEIGRAHV